MKMDHHMILNIDKEKSKIALKAISTRNFLVSVTAFSFTAGKILSFF